jgi:F-type H+-transporting ATPase subunit gamma
MSLKDIKSQIRAIHKIHQVTKAMEAVSAVKMRRSQSTAIEARPFALHSMGILRRLLVQNVTLDHPLITKHPVTKRTLMVVITSDRGLAGALNTYVLKRAERYMSDKGITPENGAILAIGKKGSEYFSRRGFEVIDTLERWGEGVLLADPQALAERLIELYTTGVYDRVMLVYSNFESTFVQSPVARRVLPLSYPALEEVIDGIVSTRGKYSELRSVALRETTLEYQYEPRTTDVLNALLPYLIGIMVYHAVLEATASEHSARMVAMKSASDRARDLGKELRHEFNKARQTAITAEVSEITSGIEAMK